MTAPTLDGLGRWTVVCDDDDGDGATRERWVDAALGDAPRVVVLSADGMPAVSRVTLADAVARHCSEHALRHAVTAVTGRVGWAVVAIRAPGEACDPVAWQAGAEAARAGDVAALRARRERLMREGCVGTILRDADCVDAARAVELAADEVAGLPLPAPPAPPQSPEAPPDGGTEPGGGGAPARGLPVAAAAGEGDRPTVETWRVVVEGEGDEGPQVWPVEVWREGDGWACDDVLAATRRSRGPTPEAAILRRTVFRAGARLREFVPPGMRTADERVAHALASRGDAAGQAWERAELAAALDSLNASMVTMPHDWATDHRFAWQYGILVGWGPADETVAARHRWDAETVARLRRFRAAVARFERGVRR